MFEPPTTWQRASGHMRLRSALPKLVRAAQPSMALPSRRIILGLFPAEGEPVRGSFWKCTPRGYPDGVTEEPIVSIHNRNG